MSQENIEVVRRMNAAFNRGDLDAAFALYEPKAIWHSRTDEPDTGDYHGLEAIREMADMWRGLFDQFQLELEDYLDAQDCVVTSGWICGRGRESGAEVRDPYACGSSATGPKPSKPYGCADVGGQSVPYRLAIGAYPVLSALIRFAELNRGIGRGPTPRVATATKIEIVPRRV